MGKYMEDSKSDASEDDSSSEEKSMNGSEQHSESEFESDHEQFGDGSLSNTSPIKRKPTLSEWGSDDDDDDDNDVDDRRRPSETRKDIGKRAIENPDLYGIRRSERKRKEAPRLNGSPDGGRGHKRRLSDSDGSESEYSETSRLVTRNTRSTRNSTRQRVQAKKSSNMFSSGEEEEEEEESDSYGSEDESPKKSRKGGKKSNKQRSTRRQQGVFKVSYKEESDDITDSDDLIEIEPNVEEEEKEANETIEKVLKKRIGRKGATGSKTTVYNIVKGDEKNEDPNKNFDPSTEEGEDQYLIKWKNWSYMHNTWESEASLREQKVNGIKKLENFMKKEEDKEIWKSKSSVDDIEMYDFQQELTEELCEKHCLVERIISHIPKAGSSSNDYLVKWQGLPYSECTQEDGSLIQDRFPEAVKEYEGRLRSVNLPNKNCKALKYRPKFQPFKTQPDCIGDKEKLILRDYQLAGLNWLLHSWCKHNGAILADEMGLGKTIQTISFLSVLMTSHGVCGPFLLVVPLSTLVTWQKEFEIWAPDVNVVVYIGDVPSRDMIRQHEWYQDASRKQLKFNVLITTYEIILKDKANLGSLPWAVLGVDEAHRLKNDDSRLYKVLMDFNTNHRVFITGTPLQNSLKELWSLLHFIMPDRFDDWEEFERRHSSADKTGFRHLHQELEPYLLRRVKKDVEKSLPAKVEQILRVEMTKVQKHYYKLILKRNYKELMKGAKGSRSTFVNLVMELKKCCNHSFLVRQPDDETASVKDRFELLVKSSGKLILLDKLLLKLKGSGHRVLIFSQMVRMLDILAEYLNLRHFQYQRLDGTIKGEIRKQAMDHFNAEGSQDFCFLLSTRAGGLGVNLATADTVIIFDSDWNPQNDLQAMARAHRIGQKNQVSVYRLVTKNSVEEDIVERAKKKMVLDHLVIQRMDTTGRTVLNKENQSNKNTPFNKDELNAILKFGAEELFKEGYDDDEDLQVDIDDILRLAETRNTEELKNNATDELLSKFKVVSFDNLEDQEIEHNTFRGPVHRDWEDIIPADERRQMDDEEKMRLLKEQNLPPRSRKTITGQSRNFEEDEEGGRKRRRRVEEDESSSSEYDSADGEKGRRRGRTGKEVVKGFNESELRRFLKSLKKFGKPLERIEDISEDAELQEKSESDLKNLGDMILTRCEHVMRDFENKLRETTSAEARKAMGRPTFRLGSITVNARSVLQAVNELEPLAELMPAEHYAREKFQITVPVKNPHFDCSWNVEDDARLLRGVYECGFGNWEAIKMDTSYRLQDKILPDGDLKPQAKQLQARTEYLMKVLRKLCHTSGTKVALKKVKTTTTTTTSAKSSKKIKSKEIVDENANSDEGVVPAPKEKKDKKKNGSKDQKSKKSHHHGNASSDGPVHITTHKTVSIEEESGLDPQIFLQCKEKMRVVKKSLQYLKNPNEKTSSDEKEVFKGIKECLIKIGDHINTITTECKDSNKAKEWRGYLWHFVSMFTDNFEPSRLHKMYRQALKKKMAEQERLKPEQDNNDKASSASHYSSKQGNEGGGSKKEERRKRDHEKSRWGQSQGRGRQRDTSNYQRGQGSYGDYRQPHSYREDRWRSSRPSYGEHDQQPPPPPSSGNYLPPPSQFYQSGYPAYDRNKGGYQRSGGSFPSSSREYSNDSPRYYGSRRPYGPGDRRDSWGPGNSFSGYENPSSDNNKNFNRKRRYDDMDRSRDSRSSKDSRMSPGISSRYPSANPLPPPPNPGHAMHYDIPLLPPPPSTQYSGYPPHSKMD